MNPYGGYDREGSRPFLYRGPATPSDLPAMARVLTIELDDEAVAYPYTLLQERRVVKRPGGRNARRGCCGRRGRPSALDHSVISSGRDVGAGGALLSRQVGERVLEFELRDGRIVDTATGSVVEPPGAGRWKGELARHANWCRSWGVNHFWFSWAAFRPQTRVFSG